MFSFYHVQDFPVFLEGMHLRMLLWVPLIPTSTERSVTFQHLVFIANTGCCRSAINQKYFRMKQNWSGHFLLRWEQLFVFFVRFSFLFLFFFFWGKEAVRSTRECWRKLPSHWKVHFFTFSHVGLLHTPKWSGSLYFCIFLHHQLWWVL